MKHSCLTKPDFRRLPVIVYALCEPTTGEVRYIGRTEDIAVRLRVHRYQGSRAIRSWLRGLGCRPLVRVLCVVAPGDDATAAELAAIRNYGESGRLLNVHGRKLHTIASARN